MFTLHLWFNATYWYMWDHVGGCLSSDTVLVVCLQETSWQSMPHMRSDSFFKMFILPTSACFAVIFFCCSFTAVNYFAVNTDNIHSLFSNDVYLICGRWYNTMKMPHENVPYIVRHLDSSEMSWYVKINKSFRSFDQLLKTCCIFGYFLEIFSWADTPFSNGMNRHG